MECLLHKKQLQVKENDVLDQINSVEKKICQIEDELKIMKLCGLVIMCLWGFFGLLFIVTM